MSSAVRRSTDVRFSSFTMRASVSLRPVVSPTTPTRSPTTAVRPSSRARIAVTRGRRQAPRPTVRDPGHHHAEPGVLVLGAVLRTRAGAFARTDSDIGLVIGRAFLATVSLQHLLPHAAKAWQGLGRGLDVLDLHVWHAQMMAPAVAMRWSA